MRVSVALVALLVGGVALGFWAGRVTAATASPAPGAAAVAASVELSPRAQRTAQGLVCATLDRRSTSSGPSCEAEVLRTQWCQAQLDQCQGQRRAVRQPWPAASSSESPERWADAVEEALAECALGAELELVECSEYPCVAALRPDDPSLDESQREQEMHRLMDAARGCQPLRKSFGLADEGQDDALDVYRLDARCGDGRESFFVLSALDPQGPAYGLLSTDNRDELDDRDFSRWLYRRADDVSGLWPCAQ